MEANAIYVYVYGALVSSMSTSNERMHILVYFAMLCGRSAIECATEVGAIDAVADAATGACATATVHQSTATATGFDSTTDAANTERHDDEATNANANVIIHANAT